MAQPESQAVPRMNFDGGTEFALNVKNFQQIAAIMYRESGISLPENKMSLVYSRLAKRLRALNLKNFNEYCAIVGDAASESGRIERDMMIAALTTNVTRFFREPHHFEHLKTNILPALLRDAKAGKPVRLWSAACSTGQEPYSMALCILSLLPDAANYDIKILATDIDPNVIATGEAGLYAPDALAGIPPALLQRWFTPVANSTHMQADQTLRSLIRFRKLNLIGNWPMREPFQAIFCRNVVIYFDAPTQSKIWSRFVPLLAPQGALYIGHSERVAGPAETLLRSDGVTIYRHAAKAGGLA